LNRAATDHRALLRITLRLRGQKTRYALNYFLAECRLLYQMPKFFQILTGAEMLLDA